MFQETEGNISYKSCAIHFHFKCVFTSSVIFFLCVRNFQTSLFISFE